MCTSKQSATTVQGFTRSQLMPPLVKCLHHIAPAAAMVNKFVADKQNTNKKLFFKLITSLWIFFLKMDPLLSSSMQQASFKCETTQLELKSLQIILAIKCCQRTKIGKVINLARSLLKKVAHMCASRLGLILCGTQSTKNCSTWYCLKSSTRFYGFSCSNSNILSTALFLPFYQSTTYTTIFRHPQPQPTTQTSLK